MAINLYFEKLTHHEPSGVAVVVDFVPRVDGGWRPRGERS